jgi:hypothetical protein
MYSVPSAAAHTLFTGLTGSALPLLLLLMHLSHSGIRILMNVDPTNRPTTCRLLYGDKRVGQFKRTVVR